MDVGDVIDEGDHLYAPPLPHGGWTTLDVLNDPSGAPRFDGGRIIPDAMSESFVVKRGSSGPLPFRVRIDAGARGIVAHTAHASKELVLEPAHHGSWRTASTSLDTIEAGEVITLEARGSEYRDYHVWIERDAAAVTH